jgi:preprotein translocase subunit SecG
MQRHLPMLDAILLALSIACIVVVVVILLAHPSGEFFGPW